MPTKLLCRLYRYMSRGKQTKAIAVKAVDIITKHTSIYIILTHCKLCTCLYVARMCACKHMRLT